MFPTHQSDDFLYEISDIPHYEDFVQQNLTFGEASVEGSNPTQRTGKVKRLENLAAAKNNDGNVTGNDAKKIMRKEIERERRQQMSKLYGELRSLLPLESIKGKRAVSDHTNEAVNYINCLKKRIQQLSVKRDKLKRLSDLSALDRGSGTVSLSDNCSLINCVAVHPYLGGVEIVVNSGFGDESSHLSSMIQFILQEGLDVVRCVSSQTNEGFLYTIQSEFKDSTQIDLPRLQSELSDLISH